MATRYWIGSATAIQERKTITVGGTWATNDTITLTVGYASLVLTVGSSTTTADVASNIQTMLSSSGSFGTGYSSTARGPSVPEFAELEASVSGNIVTVTHRTRGVPFSLSATTSGSGTLTVTTTQSATGPNHWNNAQNWSGSTLPASGDDVIIDSPVSILYGLNQSSISLASLIIGPRFASAAIGLSRRAQTGYTEYRDRALSIGSSVVQIFGSSPRIRLALGSAATNVSVFSSGASSESGAQAVQITGSNSSNVLYVGVADVGVAADLDQTATFPSITVNGGMLTCGPGATLTNVTLIDASASIASSTTTINARNSRIAIRGGTHADIDADGTNIETQGTTTITTLRQIGGNVDLRPGTTWTTINKLSGTLTLNSGGTTLTSRGGTTSINIGTVTTLNAYGGIVRIGECSITTLNARNVELSLDHVTTQTITVGTFNVESRKVKIIDSAGRLSASIPYAAGTLELSN